MIIERLSREHRNIEMLLAVLEHELKIFDRGDRPDYEVIRGIISYSNFIRRCTIIPRKILVFANSVYRNLLRLQRSVTSRLSTKGAERLRRVARRSTVYSRIVKSFGNMWGTSFAISSSTSGVIS